MTSPWPSPDPSTLESSTPPPSPPVLTAPRAVAVVAGAVLLVAGLVGLLALAGDGEERPDAAVATTTLLPEPTADVTTPVNRDGATAPGGTESGTGSTATTTPAGSATTPAPGAAAPGLPVPGGTGPGDTPAPAPAPAASATPAASPAPAAPAPAPQPAPAAPATPATPVTQRAVALAQELGDALAAGRWDAARALNPGRNESDEFLQQAYGALVRTTVVPANVVETGRGHVDLRLGLVAHEDQPTGRQSVLMCAHWTVDVPASTVIRHSFDRLRVEPGFVDPASRAAELRAICAAGG